MFTGEHLCPNPKNRHTLSLNQRQSWPPSCAALLEREPPHPPTSYMPAFVLISLEKPGASSRGHCEHTCRDPGVHNSLGRGGGEEWSLLQGSGTLKPVLGGPRFLNTGRLHPQAATQEPKTFL